MIQAHDLRERIMETAQLQNFLCILFWTPLTPQFDPFKIIYNTHKEKWTTNELVSMCVQEEGRLNQEGQLHKVIFFSNNPKKKNPFPKGKKGS